ncbi:MAG: sigma 54-interacting transcriptional regulator [Desulfobacterales bacterium]|nr:sigma 54-interacting transcriptional regulator [Desulfobacterales bacterium]
MILCDAEKIQLKDVLSREMIKFWDKYPEGVYVTDKHGMCLYINPLQKKNDGFQGMDIIGKSTEALYWSDRGMLPSRKSISTRKPVTETSWKYNSKTNQVIKATIHSIPLFYKNDIAGAIVICNGYRLPSKAVTQARKEIAKINELHSFNHIVGEELSFKEVIKTCKHIAPRNSPVLIYGETGTGKELFAQAIHNESRRRLKPFVPVNCSAIPEALLEGVLFGTTKGAFTNAMDKKGLLESADGGTIFLDEMNSMPVSLQPKLLRFLQEKKIRRVGDHKEINVDVRVISAFNIHPQEAVARKLVRQDIYYRLAVFFIEIPPLRRRKLDIPALCHHFLFKLGKKDIHISDDIFNSFFQYDWPGNVRELENIVEGSISLLEEEDRILSIKDLPGYFNKNENRFREAAGDIQSNQAILQGVEYLKQIAEKNFPVHAGENNCALSGKEDEIRPMDKEILQGLFEFFRDCKKGGKQVKLKDLLSYTEGKYIDRMLKKSQGNISRAARNMGLTQQTLSYKLKTRRSG